MPTPSTAQARARVTNPCATPSRTSPAARTRWLRSRRGESGRGARRLSAHGTISQALGEAAARDDAAFRELLPELLSGRGHLLSFGRGLATACAVPEELWNRLVTQLGLAPENNRNTQVLGGFL